MPSPPIVASIRIPGEWRDAWLYREHLIVWRRDNSMMSVPVAKLVRAIAYECDRATATGLEYLLMRNDWKNSEQFRKLMEVPGVADSIRASLAAVTGGLTLNADTLGFEPADVEPASGALLDSHIYANRIYSASTEGLFESYFFARPAYESKQVQLMSRRIADVSAKYACLNASAEEEGLWYSPILFEGDRESSGVPAFERIADVSLGNSYASRHLLNYGGGAAPQFLRAEAQKGRVTENAEYDEWQVNGYEKPREIGRAAASALRRGARVALDGDDALDSDIDEAEIEVLGNSDYRLLINWRDRLRVVDISAYEHKEIAIGPDRKFSGTERIQLDTDSVLETYSLGGNFLVETFDEVRLLTEAGSWTFFNGAAARVRTFTSSKRHKDVAVIVDDDAMHIVGFLALSRTSGLKSAK